MKGFIYPILLVEDNPMDVDLTLRAFARSKAGSHYQLEIVRDGAEALEQIKRWETGHPLPLFILLDLKLPKVDGMDVLHQLKSHPRFKVIPVVVLTTSSEERDIQNAYMNGANSYIVKPVDFDQFMRAVDQLEEYWGGLNTHSLM